MVDRNVIVDFLNNTLCPSDFEDNTYNGLQVEGKSQIKKIGFSENCALDVFEEAVSRKCDMLITHHALIWGGWNKVTALEYARLAILIKNDINLYVSHLPLDKHPELGNNVSIIRELGGKVDGEFANIGYFARFQPEIDYLTLLLRAREIFGETVSEIKFGPDTIDRIAVSSGEFRVASIESAISQNVKTILTGEGNSNSRLYYPAKEHSLNIILAGHYATETFGVRNLMKLISKQFSEVETEFIDIPIGW